MSSESEGENPSPSKIQGFLRKVRPLRVSRDLSRGRSSVGDGQPVEIPVPPLDCLREGVTQEDKLNPSNGRDGLSVNELVSLRQIRGLRIRS